MADRKQRWQQVEQPAEGEVVCFELQCSLRLPDGRCIEMQEQGFVICYQGRLQAWRNHCPHAGSPLDWIPGRFFSDDGTELVCHTHGARFDPLSGACLAGPCPRGLYALPLREQGDVILVPRRIDVVNG